MRVEKTVREVARRSKRNSSVQSDPRRSNCLIAEDFAGSVAVENAVSYLLRRVGPMALVTHRVPERDIRSPLQRGALAFETQKRSVVEADSGPRYDREGIVRH